MFVRLDLCQVLINSAGIMAAPYSKTVDGIEHHMAVNHFAPFLFTTLLMAGTKFFEHKLYPKCRELADLHAIKAFAEARKSVEIVQAFMCLTYWREADDTVRLFIPVLMAGGSQCAYDPSRELGPISAM